MLMNKTPGSLRLFHVKPLPRLPTFHICICACKIPTVHDIYYRITYLTPRGSVVSTFGVIRLPFVEVFFVWRAMVVVVLSQ